MSLLTALVVRPNGSLDVAPMPPASDAPAPSSGFSVTAHPLLSATITVADLVAMGVSYSRNHSIPWAIAHGFVGVPYLAYVGVEAAQGGDLRQAWSPR